MPTISKFLKAIRKPVGNVQIKQRHAARTFLLAGCDKNFGNEAVSQQETRQNCPTVIEKNVAISVHFSSALHFGLF